MVISNSSLEVEFFSRDRCFESRRKRRRTLYRYRFNPPFDERENLELLAAIKELHEIAYYNWPEELVTTIKEKINTILDAKQNINIKLSDDLETESSNLRTKFLISVCYRGLHDLYKSFSDIKISKGDSIDVFYDKSNDEVLITLTDEEINKAISQHFWDLFGEYSPALRVKLIDRFLVAHAGFTEEDIDLVHITLTLLGDLYEIGIKDLKKTKNLFLMYHI